MTAKHLALKSVRTRCFAARIVWAVAALGALATAVAANDNNEVDVHLRGSVTATCEVAGRSRVRTPVTVGNINQPGSTYVEYPINCNAPFGYEISSRFGGLRRTARINGQRPVRLYNVNVNIPTDIDTINDTCSSANIVRRNITCPLSDSGNGVALDQTAKIEVSWEGGDDVPAGTYSDRLTFTVKLQP